MLNSNHAGSEMNVCEWKNQLTNKSGKRILKPTSLKLDQTNHLSKL